MGKVCNVLLVTFASVSPGVEIPRSRNRENAGSARDPLLNNDYEYSPFVLGAWLMLRLQCHRVNNNKTCVVSVPHSSHAEAIMQTP